MSSHALGGISLRTFRKWLLDQTALETGFSAGMVRDVERWMIPQGGSYTIIDFMIDNPGELRKRGGTDPQSGVVYVTGATTPVWVGVFCPEFPGNPKVMGIASDGGNGRWLYDLTGSTPSTIGQINIEPWENISTYVSGTIAMAIITSGDPGVNVVPKKVTWNGSAVVVADLGGSPPTGKVSSKFGQYFALANNGSDHQNRIWWCSANNPEDWTTINSYQDMPEPIVAMTDLQGALLVWTRHAMYRAVGSTPPGHPEPTLKMQTVAQIGCIDARSVVKTSNLCYFANEEGVFATDGASVTNVTLGKGNGITQLWRNNMKGFSVGFQHVVAAGVFQDLFLIVSVIKDLNTIMTFLCYLPSGGWSLLSNPCAGSMYANSLATVNDQNDLYAASLWKRSDNGLQLSRLAEIFDETDPNPFDADGSAVQPVWESRVLPGGSTGLKRFGNGRIIYSMAGLQNPTLKIMSELGLQSEGNFEEVKEGSPQPATDKQIKRSRFRIFRNGMGLKLRIEQHGASNWTSIIGVEYELGQFFTAEMEGQGEGT